MKSIRTSILQWTAFITILLSSRFPPKAVVAKGENNEHFCDFDTPSSSDPDSDMGQQNTNRACPENSFCSMDLRNNTICLKALEDGSIIPPTICVCKTGEFCHPNLIKHNSFASRKLSNCEKSVLQRRISMWIEVALENSTGQWGAPCNPRAETILTNYILKRDQFSSGDLYEIESQLRSVLAPPTAAGQVGFCDRAKLFRCVSCGSGEKNMCFCADGTDVRRYLLEKQTIRSEFCYAIRGDRTQDLTKIMPLLNKQKEKVARHYDVNNVCLLQRKVNTSSNSAKVRMGICTEDMTWLASKSYSDPCDIGETMGGEQHDVDYNSVNRSSNEIAEPALYLVHFVLVLLLPMLKQT